MENSINKIDITITKIQRLESLLGIINQMLVGFITIYVTSLCLLRIRHGDVPWHALLCTIGFNFLMAEGLLSYYKGNLLSSTWCRKEKVILHTTLQLLGSFLGIVGIIIRMTIDKHHFTTLHGKIGFAAFILCLVSLFFGLSSLFSSELKNYVYPILNKSTHSILGILTYITATVSLIFGFNTYIFYMISPMENYYSSVENTILVLKVTTFLSLILTIYGPTVATIETLWKHLN